MLSRMHASTALWALWRTYIADPAQTKAQTAPEGTFAVIQQSTVLSKAGAKLRFGRQRGIMHNKFTIVDGKAIETGSFNYTNHAYRANNENQIYLWDKPIVDRYQKRFEEIWSNSAIPN